MVRHCVTFAACLTLLLGSSAVAANSVVDSLKPFAYYPLDEHWGDASGNDRHGLGQMASSIDSSEAGARSTGRGSSASMNSGSGGMRTTAENPFSESGDMTLAMWVKWDTTTSLTLDGPSGRVGDISLFGKRTGWGDRNTTGSGYTNDPRVSDGLHIWRPFDNLGRGACAEGEAVTDECQAQDAEHKMPHLRIIGSTTLMAVAVSFPPTMAVGFTGRLCTKGTRMRMTLRRRMSKKTMARSPCT